MSIFDSHATTGGGTWSSTFGNAFGNAAWGNSAGAYAAAQQAQAARASQRAKQKQAWQEMKDAGDREAGNRLLAAIYPQKQAQLMALLRLYPKVTDAQFTLA